MRAVQRFPQNNEDDRVVVRRRFIGEGRTRVEGAAHSMGMVRRQVIRSLESARVEMAGKWDVIAALGGSTLF